MAGRSYADSSWHCNTCDHPRIDYLVGEVLQTQPESVQTFLLQTSILGEMTGPLCDAVTGRDGGAELLERLEKGNLFVVVSSPPERTRCGMGVRRQIYIEETDDRLLEAESRRTGLSVSELIRRAVHQCYGAGRQLSWDDVFAHPVRASSAVEDPWIYDTLFDAEWLDSEQEISPRVSRSGRARIGLPKGSPASSLSWSAGYEHETRTWLTSSSKRPVV